MRTDVRIVGGLVSSGSCCVKSVNSGALCHAGSERSPSITGGTLTRTARNWGCSGQFTACAAAATPRKITIRRFGTSKYRADARTNQQHCEVLLPAFGEKVVLSGAKDRMRGGPTNLRSQ